MRVALKIGYEGTRFAGNQVQPGVRTVHHELARGLARCGMPDTHIRWAGRTDTGVSAAGNVVVFESILEPEKLIPALDHAMNDVWVWAWAEVDRAFEPRHARRRHYRYHLATDLDVKPMREALDVFVGTHDFTAFARIDPGVEPKRTVQRVDVARRGPFVVIDVEGENFLYNQVRRMVEAARRVAAGELTVGRIEKALANAEDIAFGTAAPEGLVLMDVEYPGLTFERLAPRRQERALERLIAWRNDAACRAAIMDAALDSAGAFPR